MIHLLNLHICTTVVDSKNFSPILILGYSRILLFCYSFGNFTINDNKKSYYYFEIKAIGNNFLLNIFTLYSRITS